MWPRSVASKRIRNARAFAGTLLVVLFLVAGSVRSEELPVFYEGVRPLGMGGAFVAIADDENAIFYNPAGLNQVQGFGGVEILNPLVEVGENTISFFRDLKDVADAATDTEQAGLAADLLNKFLGDHLHLRTAVFPNLVLHNFGVGVLGQGVFDGQVHNPTGSNVLEVDGRGDIALLVAGAYGFDWPGSTLRIGVTAKVVHRQRIDQTYTAFDLVQQDGIDLDRDVKRGTGIGADVGLLYSLAVPLSPTIGVNFQNIGDVDLGDAGRIQQQVNAGLAFKLPVPVGLGRARDALDVVDVTRDLGSDEDLPKRIHAGLEYQLPVILGLRAGLNQGYASFGATVDFWILKAAYAYYIEEVGAFAGQTADKRHLAQISLGF